MHEPSSTSQVTAVHRDDRLPAVAGRFYSGDADTLATQIADFCRVEAAASPALAVVGPHAGFMFSGHTAGQVYGRVEVPPVTIVIGPNHTGMGRPLALLDGGRWMMPMGPVAVDTPLAARVRDEVPGAEIDALAHLREHGIETHVPFIQHRRADARIVPIVSSGQSLDECEAIGAALARVVAEQPAGQVLLAASTDMTHFLSAEEAGRLDAMALARVEALDPRGLYETVRRHQISMCGVVPTTIVLYAALALGATRAELVEYTHSGMVTGDHERVVGYAGLVIR